MTPMDLRNQTVVVVGGSSGIGFSVAKAAIGYGASVHIGSSSGSRITTAIAQLGRDATGQVIRVDQEESVASFFEDHGPFDHLVFTAGDWDALRRPNPVSTLDLKLGSEVFQVRFWGAILAIKHSLRCISKKGSVTLTGGMVAHRPRKGAVLNTAMAGAIEHLVQALAVDLTPLRVNAVCPGIVLTEVWDRVPADRREILVQQMTAHQPIARAASPTEIAEAYIYLMRSTYSTGQVVCVDGGMSLV